MNKLADNFGTSHKWNCGNLSPNQRRYMLFCLFKHQIETGRGFFVTSENVADFTKRDRTDVTINLCLYLHFYVGGSRGIVRLDIKTCHCTNDMS